MKRKIFFSMIMAVLTALVACALVTGAVYYGFFESQVKSGARTQAAVMKSGYENSLNKAEFLNSLPKGESELRISLIEPDGNVCFDTYADSDYLYDHLDRPEISTAIESGSGEAVRYSKTLKKNSYYYALMLNDGNIVRVATVSSTMGGFFSSTLPILICIFIALLIICFIISRVLTNRIVRPLEYLSDHLDELSEGDNYDELNPFVEKISKQNDTIQKQLKKSKEERDTITLITDNMKEGLVLLGKDRYILSVNKGAVSYLNRHDNMDFVGENLIVLTREKGLLDAVDKALMGTPSDKIIYMPLPNGGGKRAYHFFANPVTGLTDTGEEQVTGAILLLLDVTSQQRAEKIRREFSANVSHELKTPLTTISGFSEMIANGMVESKEDLARFAELISKESGRLLALIDDIIHLSQMDEKEKSVELEEIYLPELIDEVVSSLVAKAQQRSIIISVKTEPVSIKSNRAMLSEILFNLVDNAVKYNKDNGNVIVTAVKEDSFKLSVSDTGIGIAPSHHDRLFERFYRVDKSRSKQTGGTGLGLSIVKHAVELLGGELSLESELDKGTKIIASFPL